jgi:hypothetical protein
MPSSEIRIFFDLANYGFILFGYLLPFAPLKLPVYKYRRKLKEKDSDV